MLDRILYPNEQGGVCQIIPSEDCDLTVMEIALKDVPTGVPFIIVPVTAIPESRTFREAWEADFTNPDGIGE